MPDLILMLISSVARFFNNYFKPYISSILLNEKCLLAFLSQFMLVSSAITFVGFTFFGMRASYGRYASSSALAEMAIPARLAWFLQEIPSFLIPLMALWQELHKGIPLSNAFVLFMFTGHYFQRSFVYTFLIKGGKPTPIHLFLLGFIFCTWNGYIQGFYHAKYAFYPHGHAWTLCAMIGLLLFAIGMFINIHSDHILRNLRGPGEHGYKIPVGGLFDYVSGANFFGEITEWFGYALFAQTKAAWAFAFFTASNLIPRAKEHHKWYLNKFAEYPKDRTIVIPFLY